MKLQRLLRILAIGGVCGGTFGTVEAEMKLVASTWVSESQDCGIRKIEFYDFGHGLVTADGLGTDEADWTRAGAMLHIRFEHWNGNLDGAIEGDSEFKATYTWRFDETLSATSLACAFRRK